MCVRMWARVCVRGGGVFFGLWPVMAPCEHFLHQRQGDVYRLTHHRVPLTHAPVCSRCLSATLPQEAAGVDLVVSGHSHDYERSWLLNGHYDVSSTLRPCHVLNATTSGPYMKPPGLTANQGAV